MRKAPSLSALSSLSVFEPASQFVEVDFLANAKAVY